SRISYPLARSVVVNAPGEKKLIGSGRESHDVGIVVVLPAGVVRFIDDVVCRGRRIRVRHVWAVGLALVSCSAGIDDVGPGRGGHANGAGGAAGAGTGTGGNGPTGGGAGSSTGGASSPDAGPPLSDGSAPDFGAPAADASLCAGPAPAKMFAVSS